MRRLPPGRQAHRTRADQPPLVVAIASYTERAAANALRWTPSTRGRTTGLIRFSWDGVGGLNGEIGGLIEGVLRRSVPSIVVLDC